MKPPSSWCAAALLVSLALAATGCMSSRAAAPGELDAQYQPVENVWPQTEVRPLKIGERTFPACYRLVYEPSNLASMRSLNRAPQALRSGGETFEILISAEVAAALAADLRNIADRLEDWGHATEFYPLPLVREKWAKDTAAVLAVLYRLARGSEVIDPREALRGKEVESASAAVAPIARTLVFMAAQPPDSDLPLEQLVEFPNRRSLAVDGILSISFRLARLRPPPEAVDEVEEILLHGPPTALGVENQLVRKLLELRARAAPSDAPPFGEEVQTAAKAVPAFLRLLARMCDQWPKFYLASVTIGRRDGGTVVSLVADVRPGEVVRLDGIISLVPALTLEGRTRINIWTAGPPGRETLRIQFADERGGRAAMRFEHPIYALVGLLTFPSLSFPIEGYAFREIDVATTRPARQRTEQTVDVLLEAAGPSADPRRMFRYRSVRELEVRTHGETVERLVVTDSPLDYFTSERMWYYASHSRIELPKPKWPGETQP